MFTTTTEISRKGSKAFKDIDYATVLHNNNDIGMTIGWALYERLRDSWVLQDMLEDMEMEKPYFETDKSYVLLRQVSIGWCNIFATLLNMEHRPYGVRIIFHLGRALAYYQGALADGIYTKPESFIAATKRALDNVNKAIGEIDDLGRKRDVYNNVTKSMKGHLRQVHDRMVDHLNKLRTL